MDARARIVKQKAACEEMLAGEAFRCLLGAGDSQ
jgi:hypothetical protein